MKKYMKRRVLSRLENHCYTWKIGLAGAKFLSPNFNVINKKKTSTKLRGKGKKKRNRDRLKMAAIVL